MLYNEEEFIAMEYNQKIEFIRECEREAVEYQTKTKAEMILETAKTLKNSGYPIKDIKHKMLEDLGDLVTPRYVDMCLTDDFKPKNMIKKEKIAASMLTTGESVMEKPSSSSSEREELSSTNIPSIATENPIGKIVEETLAPKINPQYVESLERQILAFEGSIPYTDMLATQKIVKFGRTNIQSLINASKKATKHVIVTIDIRTNEVVKIATDKDDKKQTPKEDKLTPKQAEKNQKKIKKTVIKGKKIK